MICDDSLDKDLQQAALLLFEPKNILYNNLKLKDIFFQNLHHLG